MNPLRRRIQAAMMSGGSAWSPANLPGLLLWLDAGRITGLNDGDSVSQWNDVSGNANHWSQATVSKQPTYETNELNGGPIVRFDGVDDMLEHAGLDFGSSYTLFAVFAYQGTSNGPIFYGSGSGYDFWNISAFYEYFANSNRDEALSSDLSSVGTYISVNYQRQSLRKNGAALSLSGSNYAGDNNRIKLCGRASGVAHPTVDIAEIIVSTHSLNTNLREKTEAYLNAKYAIY